MGLLLLILFGTANHVSAIEKSNNQSNYSDEYLQLNYQQTILAGKIDSLVKDNGEYLPYFGGVYISDDSQNVILQIVKKNEPQPATTEYEKYQNIINFDESIKIEYVKNSYQDLQTEYEKLNNYFENEKNSNKKAKLISNIKVYYIDTVNNNIIIEANDIQDNLLRNLINKELKLTTVDFKESKGKIIPFSSLYASQQISVSGGYCSVGFRAKINGVEGYVTAGHCVNGLYNVLPTGIVGKRQFSGSLDAAFILTNSSYSPSNYILYNNGNVTQLNTIMSCPTLSVGTVIAKSGYYTQYTSGTVTYTSLTATINGVLIYNLVSTNATADGGDSGGTVYIPTNISGGGSLAGIVSGGDTTSSSYSMVFVREDYIQSAFGYTRY